MSDGIEYENFSSLDFYGDGIKKHISKLIIPNNCIVEISQDEEMSLCSEEEYESLKRKWYFLWFFKRETTEYRWIYKRQKGTLLSVILPNGEHKKYFKANTVEGK